MYEYIGILLGARPILHISRINVKDAAISTGLGINESKTKYMTINSNITN
jgi:hypothetical protein